MLLMGRRAPLRSHPAISLDVSRRTPPEELLGTLGLREWFAGSAGGYRRVVAITLGNGIGPAFIEAGQIVSAWPSVPPDGRVHRTGILGTDTRADARRAG